MPEPPPIVPFQVTLNGHMADAHITAASDLTVQIASLVADPLAGWNRPAAVADLARRVSELEAAIVRELVEIATRLGVANTFAAALAACRTGQRVRVFVSAVERAVAALPWELYRVPGDLPCPIGEELELSLARCPIGGSPVRPGPPIHSVTVLGLHNPDSNESAEEVRDVVDAVREFVDATCVSHAEDALYSLAARPIGNVVHILAHGVKRHESRPGSIPPEVLPDPTGVVVWLREGGRLVKRGFPINLLSGRFGSDPSLCTVVLDTCYSQLDVPGRANAGNRTCLAENLANSGVPIVVGFAGEITAAQQLPFARAFYSAISRGQPVDFAVQAARAALAHEGLVSSTNRGPDLPWRAQTWVASPKVFEAAPPEAAPAEREVVVALRAGADTLGPYHFSGRENGAPVSNSVAPRGVLLAAALGWWDGSPKRFAPPPSVPESDTGAVSVVWVPAGLDRQPVEATPFDLRLNGRIEYKDQSYRLGTAPFVALRRAPGVRLAAPKPRGGPLRVRLTSIGGGPPVRMEEVRQALMSGWTAADPAAASRIGFEMPSVFVTAPPGNWHAVHVDVGPDMVSDEALQAWANALRDDAGVAPALVSLSGIDGNAVCATARRLSTFFPCVISMQGADADSLIGAVYFRLANGRCADDAVRDTRWVATCEVDVGCLRMVCESGSASQGALPDRWVFPILFGDGSAQLVPTGSTPPAGVLDARGTPKQVRRHWQMLYRAWRPEAHVVPLSVLIDHVRTPSSGSRKVDDGALAIAGGLPAVDLSELFAPLDQRALRDRRPDEPVQPSVTTLLEARRTLRGAEQWGAVAKVECALAAQLPAPWAALLLGQTVQAPGDLDDSAELVEAKATAKILLAKFELNEGRSRTAKVRLGAVRKQLSTIESEQAKALLTAVGLGLDFVTPRALPSLPTGCL